MSKKFLPFVFLISVAVFSNAQDSLLTFDKALEKTLKNNFGLRISRNFVEQSINNNTVGNAGMLPTVDANFNSTRSDNTIKQEFASGLEINRSGVGSTNTTADLALNWTIFNGFQMFAAKTRLEDLSLQSQSTLKIDIENTITDITTYYYNLVRYVQLLKALNESIVLSQERVRIAERKMNNGSGSRLEFLQASTELNRQRAQEITVNSAIDEAKINLNRAMAENADANFSIYDSVIINYNPSYDDLKRSVPANNNEIEYYRLNERIAASTLREIKGIRYPVVNLTGRYSFGNSTSEAGFSLLNENRGIVYGVNATLPLFRGWNINRQIKNSKLDLANAQLDYESAVNDVNADLATAWRNFNSSMALLRLEEENSGYARDVLFVAQERYRVGISNNLELQLAQQTFEDAMVRLSDARFNAKLNEVSLRRLNGELVK